MIQQPGRALKVGLAIGPIEGWMDGRTARWTDILAMARRAEEVGFDSIWLPDHLLYQLEEGPVGIWECTSLLAALAATTSRVELGTAVICTSFRNPALLAKMADTIDEISGGRFILGLGAGWNDPEYHAFGYPTDHRYSRFAEAIQIISSLLRDGHSDFVGTYYQVRECELRPRGPRPSGPPIMIGTTGKKMLRLTARYADLWNTFLVSRHSRPEDLEPAWGLLDSACREVGRDPATLRRTACVLWTPSDRIQANVSRFGEPLSGTPDEVAQVFLEFARIGISHLQVLVMPTTLAGVEAFSAVLETLAQRN